MRFLVAALSMWLPWRLRRLLLERYFGYELHPTSSIGFSILLVEKLVLGRGARIGHLNMIKGLELVSIGEQSIIGNLNWITAFPKIESKHFAHQPDRRPRLLVGAHAAITHRHLIDCTAEVSIGSFTTFAGFQSQILTHSIDISESRQSSEPVSIGDYCFVGTNCVILGGSKLPDRSVLGAKSLLNKPHAEPLRLYAGVPSRLISELSPAHKYFNRQQGFID